LEEEETMNHNPSGAAQGFLRGCAMAIAVIVAAYFVCRSAERIKLSGQSIRVKGSAERIITSDWAVWSARFSSRARTLVAAYDKLQEDLAAITAYLEQHGVGAGSMEVSSVTTSILYRKTDKGGVTNEIEGYLLEQGVEVKSANISLIAKLSRDSTGLIEKGIEFTSNPPQYYYTRINDLKIQLLGEATRDAKQRAEQLALNSGSRVGGLRSASQGVFQITPEYSTEISDYGVYDTTSIRKCVKALVTVEFMIQ
jgi:hypothetical protein